MRIQFFNPPVHHYSGVHYKLNPALGLPILAAVLHEAGHEVGVWDLEALEVPPEQLAQSFAQQKERWPDAVGFTVTTHNKRGARECIEALRRVGYNGFVAVGGAEITLQPQQGLDWGADLAVVGECEGNIAALFEKRITGIVAGEAMDIARIPTPLWAVHKPLPKEYLGNMPKVGHPEGIAMWSRGCPHRCIFCSNPVFKGQAIRFRPAESVYADMAALKGLGAQSVFVYDDELVGDTDKQHKWLMEVCHKIAPLGLTWKCQGRCSQKITIDVLQAMYEAGCRAVMWGVESFSNRVLQAIKKDTNEDDIWHTLRLARQAGIGNWLFLMVGNYGETAQDLAYTEQQLIKAKKEGLVQWTQVTVCSPEPGTELWQLAQSEGWLKEQPEAGPQMAQVYLDTPWLSQREMSYWFNRLRSL